MTRIAIIEDDQAISQMYRFKFENEGFEVELADNGQDGLMLIEQYKPHIVLLDLMMPVMNGDEMLEKLREKAWGRNVDVYVLTNIGEQEIPHSIKKHNVKKIILKAELTPKQVVDIVKKETK